MPERTIKYRFYDKRIKKMYYPNFIQLPIFLKALASGKYKDILIPMQATGVFDSTKFKNLPPEQKEKWLKKRKQEDWRGFEIYEGDITVLRYDKTRTEYGVVSYYMGGYQKGGTALSSYQKLTTVVGNLYEGYPKEAQYMVDFYYENYKE